MPTSLPNPLLAKAAHYRDKAKAMRRRALASPSRERRVGLLVVAKSYEVLARGCENIAHPPRRDH
jgi:hypothetical protein